VIILKICVYAISKNEEKFVSRWVKSMSEADEIYVLDTGSTDNTVNLLKENNVHVKTKIISPWRFDTARNYSLSLVPVDTDICICTDLDEVFEIGWRKELEKYWTKETTRIRYNYNWQLDENNKPIVNFYLDKIHTRFNYKWTHPVHEVLTPTIKENIITIPTIILNHYPDRNKSRSSYLPLLELSVKESPNDDRNMHYLGREYMYYKMYDKAILTLKRHLKLKTATWKDERAASMRFISRCYKEKKEYRKAKIWLTKAIKEAPYLRDAYVERALLEYELNNYKKIEYYCLKALEITNHEKTYINEPFSWNETIYDLLSISLYYQKKYNYSLYFVNEALKINPTNKRILTNKELIKKKVN
jgi:tetratricopeptide (TPR) repeat protein